MTSEERSGFTLPVCSTCRGELFPAVEVTAEAEPKREVCFSCERETRSGFYFRPDDVRGWPAPVGEPRSGWDDEAAFEAGVEAGRAWGERVKVGPLQADGIARYAITAYARAIGSGGDRT